MSDECRFRPGLRDDAEGLNLESLTSQSKARKKVFKKAMHACVASLPLSMVGV